MPEPFDYELKLRRAEQHLRELDGLVAEWTRGKRHSTRAERDPNDPLYLIFRTTAEQPPKDPLSVVMGELLHGLRSALDLLAFSLALAYTRPLPDAVAEDSEFPIFGDEDRKGRPGAGSQMFRDNGRVKVRGVHPDALTKIEGFQPYHAQDWRSDPLWRLHVLDNINKHRLLHVAIAQHSGVTINPGKSSNWAWGTGTFTSLEGPITTDTPIARGTFLPVDPKEKMHVEIQPALDIAFGAGTAGVDYQPILPVLASIYTRITFDITPALAEFL